MHINECLTCGKHGTKECFRGYYCFRFSGDTVKIYKDFIEIGEGHFLNYREIASIIFYDSLDKAEMVYKSGHKEEISPLSEGLKQVLIEALRGQK